MYFETNPITFFPSRLIDSRLYLPVLQSAQAIFENDFSCHCSIDFTATYFAMIMIADLLRECCFFLIYGQPIRQTVDVDRFATWPFPKTASLDFAVAILLPRGH